VQCEEGVTSEWLAATEFSIRTPDRDLPARLQIAPLYDPRRLRILDEPA
jgi:hypothetical protein